MATTNYIKDALCSGAIVFNPKTRAVVFVESWLAEVYQSYRSRSLPRRKPIAVCCHETYVQFIGVLKSHGLLNKGTLEVDGNFSTVQELYNFWKNDLRKKQEQYIFRLYNTNENILVSPEVPEINLGTLHAKAGIIKPQGISFMVGLVNKSRLVFLRWAARSKKLFRAVFLIEKTNLQT